MLEVIMAMFFLLILTLHFNLAGTIRAVAVSNSACSPGTECVTLAECLSNTNTCFATNSRVNFVDRFYEITGLPTTYYIISDARDLTISGNRTLLACTTRFIGFAFINVTNLLFDGLQFDGCGEVMPEFVLSQLHLTSSDNSAFFMNGRTRVALLLGNVNQLVLDSVEVHNSYGYGVLIVDSMGVEISHSNFSSNNRWALQCYDREDANAVNVSCCHSLSHIANEGNCIGGNIMVISTERAQYAMNSQTEILNTWITHGVNLDIQRNFNENYTYTAGGLSLYSDHSRYDESVLISHCTIASNIGLSSGNAVIYIHDNIDSDYDVTITHTDFLDGNAGFERFEKTAKSGGLTIEYGYVNEHNHANYRSDVAIKNIVIQHSTFVGNMAFTAGAILFHAYIRDKYVRAQFHMINCILSSNFGYDTIVTVRGNMGNRFHNIELEVVNIHMIDNRILHEVSLFDPLLAYHHSPHISTLHTEELSIVTCVGVVIQGNELRGVSMKHNTEFRFQQENIISDNRGTEGGAIFIDQSQIMLESPEPRLYINNNTATLSGGAIYVVSPTASLIPRTPVCFFNIWYDCNLLSPGRILLKNNSAMISGSSLYGGNIEKCDIQNCYYSPGDFLEGILVFMILFDIPWNRSLTEVTSDIERICFCVNGKPECGLEQWSISAYPGMSLRVSAVAVGQLNGTNPGIVLSRVIGSDTALVSEQQMRQQVGVECNDLNYTIHSFENEQFEIVLRIVDGTVLEANQTILINATQCPSGFQLKQLECSCIPILEEHQVTCFIETQNFKIPAEVWVGLNVETSEFLAHSKCPFHKCRSEISTFTLNSTDSICSRGFSGILCGRCVSSFGATFGKIGCENCHGAFSALVIAIFVIAGPLLVVVMLYGDLTVNHGTFNGIIFYANVVQIYRSSFFGSGQINVVTVLIAWLNLDLGIQLCFYPGMTFYAQLWFQYLFPAYTIFLALILSILNWYTTLGGRIIGNNIRNVSGTLILLSYTKLLRLVAETLSFTYVSSSQSTPHRVWLYDGNILYMEAKHTALVAASLATLLLFLIPFTLLMLLEYPLLRQKTRRIMVRCGAHNLTQVYQKPYNELKRWWTGMMLLIRVLLITLHQVGIVGNQELNLIVIATFGLCILGTMWNLGSLYRNKYVTLVETFYITNLVLLAGWSEYVSSPRSQLILSHILVSAALLVFLATLSYHVITKIIRVVKERKKHIDGGQLDVNYTRFFEDSGGQVVKPTSHTCIGITSDQKPLTDILAHNI